MPILQVRDLPNTIYQKLAQQAKKEHRSISQQAIVELAKAMNLSLSIKEDRAQLIEKIHQLHQNLSLNSLSNPVEMIRKDRNR